MKFDQNTGKLDLFPGLCIRRGMTSKDVLATSAKWEDWAVVYGVPQAMRTIINLPNEEISQKTILIVYVSQYNNPITFFDIAPWDLTEGIQNRPEGKYTKRMRNWFKTMFKVSLPCCGDWGHIDASYDHCNQSTGIICNFRERFLDDDDWNLYKIRNNLK